jgi:hypothetical protein
MDLEEILSAGIFEKDDTYFLKALEPEEINVHEATVEFKDRTGVECFFNHIHIEDLINKKDILPEDLLQQGFSYANKLKRLLGKRNRFEIIVSFSIDPIIDCNVRFHLIRAGEEWLSDDLEIYEDAIAII